MKVNIDYDEFYPVYYLNNLGLCGVEVDVPNDILERWVKTLKDFENLQTEMSEFLGNDDYGLDLCCIDEVL